MSAMPEYAGRFTSFRVYEAICETEEGEETLLLESRVTALEEQTLYTVVRQRPIRVGTIHDLVHTVPSLRSIRIQHAVPIQWNRADARAVVTEILRPVRDSQNRAVTTVQLRIDIGNQSFESEQCNTLQDAIWELQEQIEKVASWWFRTCYHCRYSGQARSYVLSDREYWCYRDVPEAYEEIRSNGKYASSAARFAGDYFVDAFHMCSAWQPVILMSDQHI